MVSYCSWIRVFEVIICYLVYPGSYIIVDRGGAGAKMCIADYGTKDTTTDRERNNENNRFLILVATAQLKGGNCNIQLG